MRSKLYKLRSGVSLVGSVVLAAFIWSQFAFALHQFDHDVTEHDEFCTFCVSFDRDHDVAAGDAVSYLVTIGAQQVGFYIPGAVSDSSHVLFRSRASP